MLDIKYVRENLEAVKKAITDKVIDLDIERLLDLDEQRRDLLAEVENFSATKNAFSKEIASLSEGDKKAKLLEMQELDSRQTEFKEKLRTVEEEYDTLMYLVPNTPSPESPVGPDETANVAWSYWNPELGHVDPTDEEKIKQVPTKFDFEIKDHIELGKKHDLFDLERGVEVSGFRGYFLKNEAVQLQYALFNFTMDKLREKGFTVMQTPTLVREFALVGAGMFPSGRGEVFQVGNAAKLEDESKEQSFLAGTSEPALIAYYADQILDEKDLPIKVSGISPCYRSEVGSYGKDSKGLYRVKEFMKVEQVVICKADMNEAEKWLEALREISEEILQELKLPYRVLNIATGDMGAGKYKMYDIETWMPGREGYGETHSDSNLTDWQARRLNIRYKDTQGKVHFAYTLNNTAVASPRILIPILENNQQKDGSILIPEVLQKYLGKKFIGEVKITESAQASLGTTGAPQVEESSQKEVITPSDSSGQNSDQTESKLTVEANLNESKIDGNQDESATKNLEPTEGDQATSIDLNEKDQASDSASASESS